MINNYDRYKNMTKERYNRKGLFWFVVGRYAMRFVVPYLTSIHHERILEVGIGYGRFKDIYFENNSVTGYDINPEMGQDLGIEIIEGRAGDIEKRIDTKYKRILSLWMTEYLDRDELVSFINGALNCLLPGGILGFTVICNEGMGHMYVSMARLKGIKKYDYDINLIKRLLSKKRCSFTPIRVIFNAPFAYWVEVENE